MPASSHKTALIVGVGSGLSASLARLFSKSGLKIALASRSIDDLAGLAHETGGKVFACDASEETEVAQLFTDIDATPPGRVVSLSISFPRMSRRRSRYPLSGRSLSRSRRRAACCRTSMAQSSLQARQPA